MSATANFAGMMTPQNNVLATSPENPAQSAPIEGHFSTGNVSPDDQKEIVKIISEYRNSWAQDRLERIRQWSQNVFFWKGIQVIQWDTATNCWYDCLAWARNQSQESGEDTDLERWINPLTLMFCNVFTGTMSRTTPKALVKPRNADPNLKDTVTAKSSTEALRIMGRQNENRKQTRSIYEMLFLFGSYFRYTRPVLDGAMFGYDEVPTFADMNIETGPFYRCRNCGTETPAETPGGMNCPSCGAWMGEESYHVAGEGNRLSLKQAGVQKVPRAGVKQSLYSPLEIDVDPKCKGDRPLKQTPILAKDCEIDFGEACRMFPQFRELIQPGAEVSTTANASLEKLTRLNIVSALGGMTADNSMMNPTYSEVWVQPMAYYKTKNWDFAQRMEQAFPDGLKVSMVGEFVVDVRPAVLTKEWSHAALYANQGVYCAALANTAVSFNARFNRTMWILDDWASRAALGLNVADASRLDTEKLSGKQLPAGTIIPLPMRINGEPRPLEQTFGHFELPINPALWNYPMMLMTFCELIIGIPRQIAGQGTQEDVETLGGQQLQLTRAMTALKPYFENVKDEDACASQNAIECLQVLMKSGAVQKITDVIDSQGGAFENSEVDWTAMQGNVECYVDEDQDLPVSPEELRVQIQSMFEELRQGNPAAIAWFDIPENQDLALGSLIPGSVNPNDAQRMKTEADFQTIVEQGPKVKMNPDGSMGTDIPAHPEKHEDFTIAKPIWQRLMLQHYELRIEQPSIWISLNAYWDELDEMDAQVASKTAQKQTRVQMAAAPPPQKPDPQMQAEFNQLLQAAQGAIAKLGEFMQVSPLLTKGNLKDQVASAKEIIDTTVDAGKLMNGGK